MVSEEGRMKAISKQAYETAMGDGVSRAMQTGLYFKIKQTCFKVAYFKIDHFTDDGFVARGVSRKEYFKNKR